MKRNRSLRIRLAALFLLLAIGVSASGPGTGGRTTELEDWPTGPYLVTVFSSPAPPVTEALYLEIRVKDAQTRRVIGEATVKARAEPVGFAAERVEARATHDIAPLLIDFAAHLPLPWPGTWMITIEIDGPQGLARVAFPIQVSRSGNAMPVLWPLVLLVGSLLVVAIWARRRPRLPATT